MTATTRVESISSDDDDALADLARVVALVSTCLRGSSRWVILSHHCSFSWAPPRPLGGSISRSRAHGRAAARCPCGPGEPGELSSRPVASWKRRLNSSLRASTSFVRSSSLVVAARGVLWLFGHQIVTSACAARPGTHDERGLDRQLLDGALHGGAGQRLVDAAELEHDPARAARRRPRTRGCPCPNPCGSRPASG